jgi:prostatic aicd phosphatase
LDPTSPSYIKGIAGGNSTSLVNSSQVLLEADASDEGGVIYDSAVALTQGLWPAAGKLSNTTLANGTTVVSPLNGYQYIPIQSVISNLDVSLEGWTSCPNIDRATVDFYNSPEFQAVNSANAAFLANLTDIVDGRPVNLQNMWNIFDYMNVQYIHNKTFFAACPPEVLARARALANYHEAGIFSSSNLSSIHNIPAQAMLPKLFNSFGRLSNTSDTLLFHSISISYKPFIALFEMMGMRYPATNLTGFINYAGSMSFELRTNETNTPFLRVSVKNGTDDADYITRPLFNGSSTDVDLQTFIRKLEPYALKTRSAWCSTCGNNSTR